MGPIAGNNSVVHPNACMQMNSNTYTPSVCGSLTNCAWVQFIFSQTQCNNFTQACTFIEYWLLNHNSTCPSTPPGSPASSCYITAACRTRCRDAF